MLSKNKIKLLSSLSRKKYREKHSCFVAEGTKLIQDISSSSLRIKSIIATEGWLNTHEWKSEETISATLAEIKQISFLKTTPEVIAVVELPQLELKIPSLSNQLVLALDNIQDPGNMGTIIRMADWFGIKNILASRNSVDQFNPKVVQATMGAISRVEVHYIDLQETLLNCNEKFNLPIYGTYLEGTNIYQTVLSENGIILMGNEGQGISPELETLINTKLNIPNYPQGTTTSESLNVAIATSIICSEFRRRLI